MSPANGLDPTCGVAKSIAPQPRTVEDTYLKESFLADLVSKHLQRGGVLTMKELSRRIALPGAILEEILMFLRKEGKIEVRAGSDNSAELRYALTDRGRNGALDALLRSGYIGPAPVPLERYCQVATQQSVHDRNVTQQAMETAYADLMTQPGLLETLGPSLNSGRAIFVYGPAGTGKTFLTKRLARLFQDPVLIPYSIIVHDTVVQIHDPLVHGAIEDKSNQDSLLFDSAHDARYVRCHRPIVVSGGELTVDMLEVHYDPSTRLYQAPLQLKANNGIFILDDLGRQKVNPEQILNRWIVPMEEKQDYLTVGAGQHFTVPFDVVLVFSTNLNPLHLADEAFLRRIGYKIQFDYLGPKEYEFIWRSTCKAAGVPFDYEVFRFLVEHLHQANETPLLPCHPRDLLQIVMDHSHYEGVEPRLTAAGMQKAWWSYFVPLEVKAQGLG
ncbi:MAG: AAA family ATPase [Gammaproteobacteria bacterium]